MKLFLEKMNEGKLNERKILLEVDMTNSNNQHVKPVETKIESNFYLKKTKEEIPTCIRPCEDGFLSSLISP